MDVEELVNAAAVLLDTVCPGWERRIDVDYLQMTSASRCVLGQVFRRDSNRNRFTSIVVEDGRTIELDNGYDYAMWMHERRLDFKRIRAAFTVAMGDRDDALIRFWKAAIHARLEVLLEAC